MSEYYSRFTIPSARDPEARLERLNEAQQRRVAAARERLDDEFALHPRNDDPERYPAPELVSYTKGLPHDSETGEPDGTAAEALRQVLFTDGDLSAVPTPGDRPLVNPEAAWSFAVAGRDPHDVAIDAAPPFDSQQTAAEMVELYWQALLRDVDFAAYEENDLAAAAAAELTELVDTVPGFELPTTDGRVDPGTLFRGTLPGSARGPYISQFLYKDIPRGVAQREQTYRPLAPATAEGNGHDYLMEFDDWLAVQNGSPPPEVDAEYDGTVPPLRVLPRGDPRYIRTGRDLATYVRGNPSQQPYLAAALIMQDMGVPLDPNTPYGDSVSESFVDYGRTEYQSLVAGIIEAALHAAWYHKWLVHRRPRPEEFGGRVHAVEAGLVDTGRYRIDDVLLDSTALDRARDAFDTTLLPQAYPEGSPLHPSYPAGHATSAGACATVLKAFFDASYVFDSEEIEVPVNGGTDLKTAETVSSDHRAAGDRLTVEGEVNKLAANATVGRNWAGIHYRTDGTAGYRLGEAVAIGVIADRLRARDDHVSLHLNTFSGESINVTPSGPDPVPTCWAEE